MTEEEYVAELRLEIEAAEAKLNDLFDRLSKLAAPDDDLMVQTADQSEVVARLKRTLGAAR